MTLSAWWLVLAAVPILLIGERMLRLFPALARFDIPAPIVGGLLVAVGVLIMNVAWPGALVLGTKVATPAWTWVITPEPEWRSRPAVPVYLPFSTVFFTCVGLSASWTVARRGSWQLLLLLALATVLAGVQNVLGVAIARGFGANPLLGVVCGSLTLTGGPSTALGFAGEFERAGLPGAAVAGTASAMFGIVLSSFVAGPLGGSLVRRRHLAISARGEGEGRDEGRGQKGEDRPQTAVRFPPTFLSRLAALIGSGRAVVFHLVLLLVCLKLGAWLSYGLHAVTVFGKPLSFPVYMGSLLLGVAIRNVLDAAGWWRIDQAVIDRIAAVSLALFLAMALAGLDLLALRALAVPMITILCAQVAVTAAFARFVTFTLMGRDYDAAVTAAGHAGFALGITPNAVATMEELTAKFGPAPRAVLLVTTVGAFLIDVTNSAVIFAFLQWLK